MTERNDEGMLDALKQAATPAPSKDFRPGVIFDGRQPSEIVTPPLPLMESESDFEQAVRDLGYPLPDGMTLMLVEMQMVQHETAWKRDPEDRGKKDTAYTGPTNSWRYRFKVVPKSLRADEDLAALMAEAKIAGRYTFEPFSKGQSKIISLADFQIGKRDELGGTAETLARSEAALAAILADLENEEVEEIILVDVGDSTEGFESAPNAAQMNDLHLTEQIRVWRRILWRWIEALAPHAPSMTVVGVPSNHCRVRKGKAAQGSALDDWGIDVIAQVQDIAAVNEAAYGHIEFVVPAEHQEHVLLTLAGGQVLGVAHGHQKSSPYALATWVKSTGRKGLAMADLVIVGHFHHLVVEAFGDRQWLFICPTNDNGSSWYTPSSGERSEPGVMTLLVDEKRWSMDTIWLGDESSI